MYCKKLIITALLSMLAMATLGQKVGKGDNVFVYRMGDVGSADSSLTEVRLHGTMADIVPLAADAEYVQGYAEVQTTVDYAADSITAVVQYADSAFFYRTPLSRSDIEWTVEGPARARRYTCSINSNTLVFEMDETLVQNVTPLPHYGLRRGVLRSYWRNGQRLVQLVRSGKRKAENGEWRPESVEVVPALRVTPRELDRIMKRRLVVSTRIFDGVQLHWGAENAHVEGDIPFDTVLHFAGGTLALKRLRLPVLPAHYQHFLELLQRSNGDAYDRTGSVFVIPTGYFGRYFTEGILGHPDSLPILVGRDGERYQGVACSTYSHPQYEWVVRYQPPVELMRFFTPFGVGHFNERMAGYGIPWRDEAFYRQEVTDLGGYLQGDVLIGIWIGNYDKGGHIVSLDLKSYPGDILRGDRTREGDDERCIPLFNTCNVLEMAGQNYGKMFATDTLTATFRIPTDATSARLRYISTGHGGWGEGDEFVPKQNTILIDGKAAFTYTPWREDCGCYRDLNPVSGNFWNGQSSSDLSRSGWCPGTATQPTYFDLTPWADGVDHTIGIAIPQGEPVSGMFSHWAASAVILVEY